jgi:hypothetical protein
MYRPMIAILFILIGCASSQKNVVREKNYYSVGDWSCWSESSRTVKITLEGLVVHPKVDPKLKKAYEQASGVLSDYIFDNVVKNNGWKNLSTIDIETLGTVIQFTFEAPDCGFTFYTIDLRGREWVIVVPREYESISCRRPAAAGRWEDMADCRSPQEK